MKANDVISTLKSHGVDLWQEGGALRYRARLGALTDQEKATLKRHKTAILKALAPSLSNHTTTASQAPVTGSTAVVAPPAMECRNCVHWQQYPYEVVLGSCHVLRRMQHATSKPVRFRGSSFEPATDKEMQL